MRTVLMLTTTAGLIAALSFGCTKQRHTAGTDRVQAAASLVVSLDDSSFESQVERGVVLVDFWATWCGPCKVQGPIIEEVAAQLRDTAKVAKLDVDTTPKVAEKFGIQSIPTLIVFKNGKPVKQFVGVTEAAPLIAAVQSALDAK